MRVRHIVPSLEQRHGGPSVSVPALAGAQSQAGATVELLTTGDPLGESQTAQGLRVRTFPREWPRSIAASEGLRNALSHENVDVTHHHALWLRTLHYAQRATRRSTDRLVISPRGMMSHWAWNHHRLRKQLARRFIHPGAFEAAHGWHATSSEEADDIRRLGFNQPICVAPNGVTLPSTESLLGARAVWQDRCPATRTRRVALFFSRFHRKKRLRELLDLWLAESRGDWLLLVVGVPEDYSVAELQSWVASKAAREKIAVFDGFGQTPPYGVASLFLLPSHSENFGLVIAEAMASGVPVLVTDSTPWKAVNADDRGWCVPWENFGTALTDALAESPDDLLARGARARSWVLENYSWDKSARDLLAFYDQLPRN